MVNYVISTSFLNTKNAKFIIVISYGQFDSLGGIVFINTFNEIIKFFKNYK